ncbi:unnamed protein product [Phytophthora fragariaefolia]|uniref:Unnamed protein product n=1 Tax=Phytophthora fragariaefolia TaxID=1490495 RepID=A0A9W7D5F4_9STRA|nr:unnamed protein product [Phytophthora fragariaefolia]
MKFIQAHTEYMSEAEAHRNCMFVYWHRMMLLGYENMLRSLDTRYRCLTIPYWDHLSNSARSTAGSCKNFLDCAPIVSETGGNLGISKSLLVYNVTIPVGSDLTCVKKSALSHFCGSNAQCAGCVTRKTLSSMVSIMYPPSATFSSVSNQFATSNLTNFSTNIERGVHNIIHSTLGGTMTYLVAPADPLFYLHHALVDLLQVSYLKCQLGSGSVVLSRSEKGSDPRWFSTCARRTNNTLNYTAADTITMRGYDVKSVQDPSHLLYPFFKDLPNQYVDYVDAKDLGNYSYTYAMSGGLATIYQYCGSSTSLTAASTFNATNGTTSFLAGASVIKARSQLCPIIKPGTADDDTVKRWSIALFESARIVGYSKSAAREQMEMAICQYQEDCLGGVPDYTNLFRTNFGVDGHPRCYTLIQYLKSGDRVIGIPKWKEITTRFLPSRPRCKTGKMPPKPETNALKYKKATTVSFNTSVLSTTLKRNAGLENSSPRVASNDLCEQSPRRWTCGQRLPFKKISQPSSTICMSKEPFHSWIETDFGLREMARIRAFVLVLVTTLLMASSSTTHGQQVGASCPQPRVRKSWEALDESEKKLYLEAVGAAIKSGFHQKFIQIHTTYFSTLEAHKTPVFVYWHRMLLLGYENMLRSLNSSYECITVPYWDHLSGSAQQGSGSCSTIENCSPIIADMGGTTGVSKSIKIYNVTYAYTTKTICVNQGVVSLFCGNTSTCANCILRQRSKYMPAYPDEAAFSSVAQQLFTASEWVNVSAAIESGVHSRTSLCFGMMLYMQAPLDPIFYSHHALIDLLQTIYLKCRLGDELAYLSAESKGSDPRFWTSSVRSGGGYFSGSDNITMQVTAFDGQTYVNAWQDPKNILYPFFKDLPYTYAAYVDAKDLGNYSYTYNISGGLANLYQNCSSSNTISAISESLLAGDQEGTLTTPKALAKKPPCHTIAKGTEEDDAIKRVNIALYETAKLIGFEDWAARAQVEMVMCQRYVECIGPARDYSDVYRQNFHIDGHPRCYLISKDIVAGRRVIGIPKWRKITTRFLPCPLTDGAYKS